MGGADEAVRDLLQVVRAGLFAGAHFGGAFAGNVLEDAAERAEARQPVAKATSMMG